MEFIKILNLLIRFLLELCILFIFGFWGFKTGEGSFTKAVLGIGTPITFAIVWGTFLAPKSTLRLGEPWILFLEIIIFGIACWALYSTGKLSLTVFFGIIYIINKFLMFVWRQ